MSATFTQTALPVRDHSDYTVYPDSDGKPMGETPIHIRNIRYAVEPLETWFADDPNVYIGANMFLYYAQNNPRRHVSPDLFVVKGVPRDTEPQRRSYRTWEEDGKGPDAVVEFTSKSTKREDTKTKMKIYQDALNVREYFLFDPELDYLHPPLQGHRLVNGRYLKIKPVGGRLPSEVLGLHLEPEGELLRFVNPETARRLPIPPEIKAALEDSEAARQQADAEIARLKRELGALRRQLPER
jgi:Uma2 family endonuclease